MTKIDWGMIFDHWGTKVVTSTDKGKSAYVVTIAQELAIKKSGISPSPTRPCQPFGIITPLEQGTVNVQASFYNSNRSLKAKREPEPRIGLEFISDWLKVGEEVLLGNIENTLCAIKLSSIKGLSIQNIFNKMALNLPPSAIFALANKHRSKPKRKITIKSDYFRNPFVIEATILRAKNSCEMPNCTAALFQRSDGSNYLEVHHVTPLSENGNDSLDNVAALCPHCHREQHHSKDRARLRKVLDKHVKSIS
ncbi:HNH endonuclease [Pseudomonas putida]|uniref:HNH endonuclease n=1 Tax=Pseudomonas putida TaxID=303 RepID=UPI00209C5D7A|nr:HNH endonuclease signature motif containing protein [Pseudomonas putida]